MLKRLFIKLPLYIVWVAVTISLVIPLLFWLLTGRGMDEWVEFIDWIDEI